jgi:DNA-binding GntR family transcriptional regulator
VLVGNTLTVDAREKILELSKRHEKRGNSSEFVYWTIRDAIRNGLFSPGDRITEAEIAELLSISRTPIRKALHQLMVEHLLEKIPNRGLIVPILDISDLINNFEIEEVLFGLAARRAAQYCSETELFLMEESLTRMELAAKGEEIDALLEASAHFHELVILGARDVRIKDLLHHLYDLSPDTSLYEYSSSERIQTAISEHKAIYEAIKKHDLSVENIARHHTRNAMMAQIKARHIIGT